MVQTEQCSVAAPRQCGCGGTVDDRRKHQRCAAAAEHSSKGRSLARRGVTIAISARCSGHETARDDDVRGLVEAARTGDADAWERLYRRIYPRLRSYVAARVGHSEVEDMVNETMTRAVAGLGGFGWEPRGIDAWIFGIARNVTVDHYRAVGRSRRAMRSHDRAGEDAEPGEQLQLNEEHARVRAAFALLPTRDREMLELRVIAGLSAEEVAAALGKRAGAVRTAQSRALARLRELLAREP